MTRALTLEPGFPLGIAQCARGNWWPPKRETQLSISNLAKTEHPRCARPRSIFNVLLRPNALVMRSEGVPETRSVEEAPVDKIKKLRDQSHRYQTEVERIAREIEELNIRLSGTDVAPSEEIKAQLSDQ
jgi:hypothetical protein